MEYTVIVNGRSYDLPKKNLKVTEKLDEALKVDTLKVGARKKFEKLHAFVKEVVGEENAREMFGSDNLDEIDLSEISLAVLKIRDAYDRPISDYQADRMMENLNSVPTEKISELTKSVQAMHNIQDSAK